MSAGAPPRIGAPEDAGASATFRAARGVAPFGPFVPLLHHPALLERVESLGRAIRYEGALAADVREAAILATASFWRQPVEWAIHAPEAARAGLSEPALDALAAGRPPDDAPPQVRAAVAFVSELHRTQEVSDGAYAAVLAAFGTAGVIELVALAGYYALLAMVMNVARTSPDSVEQALEGLA